MVDRRYQEAKEQAKAVVSKAKAVSVTSDMWTSINTEAFLAVTCHFIDDSTNLQSVVLGVQHFPEAHSAVNLANTKTTLMSEWGIRDKVTCLVTDGAANMGACARELHLRHTICVAHSINLMVKKAIENSLEICAIRTNCRKIVGYFKSSTTAKVSLSYTPCKLILYVYFEKCVVFHRKDCHKCKCKWAFQSSSSSKRWTLDGTAPI